MRAFPQEKLLDATGRVSQAWQRFFQSINVDSAGGTVTKVSASGSSGISATVTNPTTTPALLLSLGDITPTSVASSGPVSGSNLSGTNTGDQDLSGLVPKTTTVNGHALSSNVSVTASDVGAVASGGPLGTPTSGNLGNCTGLPLGSGTSGNLPVGNGGTGITSFAWSTYSPTVTPGSGAFTTLGVVSGRYFTIGKITFFSASVAITTNGTAAGYVQVTLPVGGNAAADYFCIGRSQAAGKSLNAQIGSGTQNARIRNYDGTYPGADGETLEISGWYEFV
jgi:hypothetical protein